MKTFRSYFSAASLTPSTLDTNFSRQHFVIFFLFVPENRFRHFMQLSLMETICTKCQILFFRKSKKNVINLSQRMTKSTIGFVRPAKSQIRLRIRAVWSESSLIACAFNSFQAIQREIKENLCYTRWMYRLIWVFAGHTDLTVDFVVLWLIRLLLN